MVRRPSGSVGSVWEALPEDRQWLGAPHVGSRVVSSPAQRAGICRTALMEGRERSGGNLGGPGVVGRPSQKANRGL